MAAPTGVPFVPARRRETFVQAYNAEQCSANPRFVERLIQTYREIFGAAPWNEWKVCAYCGAAYGRSDPDATETSVCLRCGLSCLMDFHSPTRVAERLYAELGMPGSSPFMFVAEAPAQASGNEVLGFTWGFGLPMEQVIEHVIDEYFSDLPAQVAERAAARILHGLATCCPSGNATYISEVAVVDGARGSSMLFAQMLQAMAERQVAAGFPTWVLWTSRKSRAYQLAALLGGAPIYEVDEDIAGDDRVLIAGDCHAFLAICEKYPADKMVSYFVKTARELKAVGAAK